MKQTNLTPVKITGPGAKGGYMSKIAECIAFANYKGGTGKTRNYNRRGNNEADIMGIISGLLNWRKSECNIFY